MIDFRLTPLAAMGLVIVGCSGEEVVDPTPTPAPSATTPPTPVPVPTCATASLDEGVALPLDDAAKGQCAARALDALVGGAQVVCLAESSHGVAESTIVDAILMRHLVVDLGFRTIAYESDDAGMRGLDRFVNDGDEAALATFAKDAGETLANTKESKDLARAIASARGELPAGQKLSLRGIDVAIQQGATVRAILGYLDRVDPAAAREWKPKIDRVEPEQGVTNAKELSALLETKRVEYMSRSSEIDFGNCRTDVESLVDGYSFLRSYNVGNFMVGNAEVRDPAMARYLLRLVGEGNRVVVRAHFGHCAKAFPSQGYDTASGKFAFGKAVSEALGEKYRVVAQLYGVGTERLSSGKTGPYRTAKGTLDEALDAVDASRVMLYPVRGATPVEFERTWKLTRMPEQAARLSEQADALVFVDAPTPTTLEWR